MGNASATKTYLTVTIDKKIYREIEDLRGAMKRSNFVEIILKYGLKEFKKRHRRIPKIEQKPNPTRKTETA